MELGGITEAEMLARGKAQHAAAGDQIAGAGVCYKHMVAGFIEAVRVAGRAGQAAPGAKHQLAQGKGPFDIRIRPGQAGLIDAKGQRLHIISPCQGLAYWRAGPKFGATRGASARRMTARKRRERWTR
jgi:hypothetical protein